MDQVEGMDAPTSITELHEHLLNHEAKLLMAGDTIHSHAPVTVNVAQHRNHNNNYINKNKQRNTNQWVQQSYQHQWSPAQQTNLMETKGLRPYLGRCQICGVQGHSAKRCSQLQSFQATTPQQQNIFTPWNPRAKFTTAAPYTATNWIMDSGATHHITFDLANLSMHQPYQSGNDVMIADGSMIPIQQTGFSTLSTPIRSLDLQNVLYVTNINKDLISVYRLCNSNKVSVNFFPTSFQVKDLKMEVHLVRGKARDELYEWPLKAPQNNEAAAYPSSKTTLSS